MATATQQERCEKLSRNIKTIMEAYRISVKELSYHIGHERHTVTLRLKCPWLLTVDNLEKIAEVGGITMEELMFGDLINTRKVVDVGNRRKEKS